MATWLFCKEKNQIFEEKKMATKTVPVAPHRRSPPSTPAYPGPGNKPGPKPVSVPSHKRSPPSK
jgi:hypothetical protein